MPYYAPTQHYPPHCDTDTLVSYPLTLHPRATIETYRARGPQPLKAPCRQCAKKTSISPTQLKLFLTIERLLQEPAINAAEKERNEENDLVVNYGVGVLTPFVEEADCGTENKGRAWPFVDEFELGVVTKLLQKVGEGLNERCLDMYLLILKSIDIESRGVVPVVEPPLFKTLRKPKSYRSGRYIPPSPQKSSPLRPPLSSILRNKPPLRSFSTLKDLFEIFDRIERGSYAAACLMEAYADLVVNEACIDCWAKHNIIDVGDEEEDDIDFVDACRFLGRNSGQAGLKDVGGSDIGFRVPVGGVEKHVHAPQALNALPGSREPRESRTPFLEVGSNVRSTNPGKQMRGDGKEEGDGAGKGRREGAKKQEARWRPNMSRSQNELKAIQTGGAKAARTRQSVRNRTQTRSREEPHAKVTRGEGFVELDSSKAVPKQRNRGETNAKVSQSVRGGTKITKSRNRSRSIKEGNHAVRGRVRVSQSNKSKQWSIEEINGKEFIIID